MYRLSICSIILVYTLVGCSPSGQFASYSREAFETTMIGFEAAKVITFKNQSTDTVEHISGLNFDASANVGGHFRIEKVEVGGQRVADITKDITIPAGSIAEVTVVYRPLNLETTVANYGGWTTGLPERWVPKVKGSNGAMGQWGNKAMKLLLTQSYKTTNDEGRGTKDEGRRQSSIVLANPPEAESDRPSSIVPKAIHRAMLIVLYDYPTSGIKQIELMGEAVPGPNGEITATPVGAAPSECPKEEGKACYTGSFAIDLPGIMTGGPQALELTGPVVFDIAGSDITLDMNIFPSVLVVLKGNGPGEPLEGKPVSVISIIISGAPDVVAAGSFDGSRLELHDVAFRIRIVLGEVKIEDITPSLQAAVDFVLGGLSITTSKPYTNGSITLSIETTLSPTPSGNPLFDQFLGGAEVVIIMDGTLIL